MMLPVVRLQDMFVSITFYHSATTCQYGTTGTVTELFDGVSDYASVMEIPAGPAGSGTMSCGAGARDCRQASTTFDRV